MKKKDLFWGLLLVLAAVLVIINKFGFFPELGMFEIVATLVLVTIMIKSIIHVSFPGILFPAALLCIIYSEQWGIQELTPWPVLLTALLGSIGLSLIFKKKHPWQQFPNHHFKHHDQENFDEVINQPDGSSVSCSVSFGSSMKYINTDNFERADIHCSFGAMKVYFDNAVIASGTAELNLDVSFAGVELYIPRNWKIVNQVNVSLGGMEEKNSSMAVDTPVLIMKGNVSFSGVEIIYI